MASPTQKPDIVCVPYFVQGHINPFMHLAKLLHSKGFHITFVNNEFNHERLLRSQGPDFIKGQTDSLFETISDGMPPSNLCATQDGRALSVSMRKHCYQPFKELVMKLSSTGEGPKVSCIISDVLTGFAVRVAKDLGIPVVEFKTASACGFMGYLQFQELFERGIVPFKENSYLCWPLFAEQQTNCRYACTSWGIGMEVDHDVKREEIEALVKEAMKGDKGKEMRQKALQWKEKATRATDIEGSSYNDFNLFLEKALN